MALGWAALGALALVCAAHSALAGSLMRGGEMDVLEGATTQQLRRLQADEDDSGEVCYLGCFTNASPGALPLPTAAAAVPAGPWVDLVDCYAAADFAGSIFFSIKAGTSCFTGGSIAGLGAAGWTQVPDEACPLDCAPGVVVPGPCGGGASKAVFFSMGSCEVPIILDWTSTFPYGVNTDGWWLTVRSDGKGVTPQVLPDWSSTAAARIPGPEERGLAINVLATSALARGVVLQSPAIILIAGRVYTYCIWVRLAPGSAPASASVFLEVLNGASFIPTPLAATPASGAGALWLSNSAWQRICLPDLQVAAQTKVYFTIVLGGTAANYYVDDASLEYTVVLPPPPPATVFPVLSASFEFGLGSHGYWVNGLGENAKSNWFSTAAAYSQTYGLAVTLTAVTPGVYLQSPGWAVFPGRAYSFCIHMRVAPAAPATISSLFSLRKVPYGGAVAGCASGCGAQLKTVTQAWQQLCLSGITFSAPENVYFSVGLGSSVGALYMDDASLTYTVA